MISAEFHCHTCYSKDSLLTLEALIAAASAKGLDKVAVTDHNRIAGALTAHKLAPDLVVIGEEIATTEGELLGYFVSEEVPKGLEPMEAIRRLKAQGAFISLSHPFDTDRGACWRRKTLEEIVDHLDGVEVFNSRCINTRFNVLAADFAREFNLLCLGGSDAHSQSELGRTRLTIPDFDSADSLRAALREARIHNRKSSPLIHFVSTAAKLVNKLHRTESRC